jgi:hypothetical protein
MSANQPNANLLLASAPAPTINEATANEAPTEPTNAAAAPKATTSASAGRSSPNYSTVQDLLVSKAFILASEDAEHGVGQRGAAFKNALAVSYKTVVAAQLRLDRESYNNAARIQRSVHHTLGIADNSLEGAGAGLPSPYPDRNGDALLRRFTGHICPGVTKFLAFEKQFPGKSGTDKEIEFTRIAAIYKQRVGHDFIYRACLEYLRDKPKFLGYMNAEDARIKKRPAGKKKTMEVLKNEAVIQSIAAKSAKDVVSVVADNDKENIEAKNSFYCGISGLVELGSNYMLMQVADEDTKKRMAKVAGETALMKMELELLEMKKKKQKLQSDEPGGSIDLSGTDVDSEMSTESSN